jgi:exodeoxyribonuclease VII small subunit
MEARTFREAYGVLQEHAETLREQTEPNIDNLLSIVTESVAAYKVCKERIDAVEKALQAALTDVGSDVGRAGGAPPGDDSVEGSEPASRRTPPKPAAKKSSTGFDDMDDDVPF